MQTLPDTAGVVSQLKQLASCESFVQCARACQKVAEICIHQQKVTQTNVKNMPFVRIAFLKRSDSFLRAFSIVLCSPNRLLLSPPRRTLDSARWDPLWALMLRSWGGERVDAGAGAGRKHRPGGVDGSMASIRARWAMRRRRRNSVGTVEGAICQRGLGPKATSRTSLAGRRRRPEPRGRVGGADRRVDCADPPPSRLV